MVLKLRSKATPTTAVEDPITKKAIWIPAKKATIGKWYLCNESVPRQVRCMGPLKGGRVQFSVYGDHPEIGEVTIDVDEDKYLVCDDPFLMSQNPQPTWVRVRSNQRKESGLRLASSRSREAAPLPAAKPDGKRVFEGKLGNTKVLLDAGDGHVVVELAAEPPSMVAKLKKLTLIKRAEASQAASKAYDRLWAQYRGKLRAGQ